jgi:hypothetical protein
VDAQSITRLVNGVSGARVRPLVGSYKPSRRTQLGYVSNVPTPPIDNVDYALLLGTLQPLIDLVNEFVDEAQEIMSSRAGLPGSDGRMIHDIANEVAFVDAERLAQPIESVQMAATLACFAAQESLASLARLMLTGPPPPIFSADVLCHSAIDASRPAWWFTEPGLSTEHRVQRFVAENVYSADEMLKLTSEPDVKARGRAIRDRLAEYASARDWPIGKPSVALTVGPQTRPTVRVFLEAEFGDPVAAHVTWSHLSAVTHGALHGLVQAIDVQTAVGGVAIMGTTTEVLSARLEIAATVVMSATMRLLRYVGWATDELDDVATRLSAELQARARRRMV